MAELIYQRPTQVQDSYGKTYAVLVYGRPRDDGTWEGWIEFHPADGTTHVLRTGRETTQSNKDALTYWASGLEPTYFEGAFERGQRVTEPM